MHDRFGDRVGDGLAHDVEIAGYQTSDEFCFESFALGKFRGVIVWWEERVKVRGLLGEKV